MMSSAWLKFPRLYLVTLPVWSSLLLACTLLFGFIDGSVAFPSFEFAQLVAFYFGVLVFFVSALGQVVVIPLAFRRLASLPKDDRRTPIAEILIGVAQLALAISVILAYRPGPLN